MAVIQALVKSVLDAPALGPEERVRLLESKVLGVPCLFPCFQHGYDQSVEVFARSVLASSVLDDAAKVSLMQAINDDGLPGLHAALRGGRTDTVRTFVQSVLCSGLSVADQFTLLAASDHEGRSGLSAAREAVYVATADEFCTLVNASQLPAQVKVQLTQA